MDEQTQWPGQADVEYQAQVQASGFGQTLRGFVKFLNLPAGGSILDVGTGPGLVPRLLSPDAGLVAGCDDSDAMLRRARALALAGVPSTPCFVRADALQLPFGSASFDAVLATNLLFVMPDLFGTAHELARVARWGGCVAWLNPSDRLNRETASAFAGDRGLAGFARFSFVNYGRIAESGNRLSGEQWSALAFTVGLRDVQVELRAGGLLVFVKGRK